MKEFFFTREQHVYQEISEKKTQQKEYRFRLKSIFTDKAGAMKVSWKITTQHHQLVFHKIVTKDDAEPN